jgi:hypothetical protein
MQTQDARPKTPEPAAASARMDWRRIAARMQRELDRADLGARATRLARVLVGLTLAEGRVEVVVQDRVRLCGLLGIGLNHIEAVFKVLAMSGIASCEREAEGWRLRVFADSEAWRCAFIYEREALCAFLAEVNAAPGQVQGELFEAEPCLQRAKAEVDREKVQSLVSCVLSQPPALGQGQFPKGEVGDTRPKTLDSGLPVLGSSRAVESSNRTNRDGIADKSNNRIESIESRGGFWSDGYLKPKLERCPALLREIQAGETPMARWIVGLYAVKPERVHSLLAQAVEGKRNPGAWLNVVRGNEGRSQEIGDRR